MLRIFSTAIWSRNLDYEQAIRIGTGNMNIQKNRSYFMETKSGHYIDPRKGGKKKRAEGRNKMYKCNILTTLRHMLIKFTWEETIKERQTRDRQQYKLEDINQEINEQQSGSTKRGRESWRYSVAMFQCGDDICWLNRLNLNGCTVKTQDIGCGRLIEINPKCEDDTWCW